MTTLRRLVARAMADTLVSYVVPDDRTVRTAGLDLRAAGPEIAATPRHASVLLVVGELPDGLNSAAAVVYAQMPRPRAILALGSDTATPLPPADVVVDLDQTALEEGLVSLRALIASDAWSEDAEPLALPSTEDSGMDHGAHGHGDHGVYGESGSQHAGHDPHSAHGDRDTPEGPAADEHEHHGEHRLGATADSPHAHHGPHGAMDHGEHGSSDHSQHRGPDHGARHEGAGPHADDEHGADHSSHHSAHQAGDPEEHDAGHHESHDDRPGHDHHAETSHHHDHSAMNHDDHATMDHGDHGGMDHSDHSDMVHASMGHDMSGHDHHMMDSEFMSMIMMTQDLPRSRDGLPMEWTKTSFGPLFPGLPAGIAATLTLDGDTVAGAALDPGHVHRGLASTLPGPAASLVPRVARLDRLAPQAYRVLASKALAAIDGSGALDDLDRRSVGTLEQERVASHLAWLAEFLHLLGVAALAGRAARLHLEISRAPDIDTVLGLRQRIERLLCDVARTPMLGRRTAGIGRVDPASARQLSGPVARAAGRPVDARNDSAAYRAIGFEPATRDTGDVQARLRTRLDEIGQSLHLIGASDTIALDLPDVSAHLTGSGMATIETPRGAASLHVTVHHGMVHEAHLSTPSSALRDLVPAVTEQAELADALVAIASLDLSPWEIDQ